MSALDKDYVRTSSLKTTKSSVTPKHQKKNKKEPKVIGKKDSAKQMSECE